MTSGMPSGEDLLALIRRQSAERRANPRGFLCEFLQTYWYEFTEEEQRANWERQVEQYPWYAEDLLACADAVLADPPEDLATLLEDCGGVWLDEQAPADWLRERRAELGRVYSAATGGS
jgi:hypothetical protein